MAIPLPLNNNAELSRHKHDADDAFWDAIRSYASNHPNIIGFGDLDFILFNWRQEVEAIVELKCSWRKEIDDIYLSDIDKTYRTGAKLSRLLNMSSDCRCPLYILAFHKDFSVLWYRRLDTQEDWEGPFQGEEELVNILKTFRGKGWRT